MSLHTSDLVLVPGQQLPPLETISGFQVRPGFFRFFGATGIPGGVNFTIQSHGATYFCFIKARKSLLPSSLSRNIIRSVLYTP